MAERYNFHLVMQAKGGVGKSVCSALMAQFLLETQGAAFCMDADPSNRSFAAFAKLGAKKLDLLHGGRTIAPGEFDEIIIQHQAANNKPDLIVDSGASSYIPLYAYLSGNDSQGAELLAEAGYNLILHCPLVAGAERADCLDKLMEMGAGIAKAIFVLWLNNYKGRVFDKDRKDDIKCLEDTLFYQRYQSRVKAVIDLPYLPNDTLGKCFEWMLNNHVLFEEYQQMDNPAVTFIMKTRSRILKQTLFDAMKPLLRLRRLKEPDGYPDYVKAEVEESGDV